MIGAPNGVSRRHGFDRWFRYPAGFSPTTVKTALEAAGCRARAVCADPFAGSASGGTYAVDAGVTFVGIEAHPLIAELGQLKFERPGEPDRLRELAEVIEQGSGARQTQFALGAELDLVQRCFSPKVLETLVGLRAGIDTLGAAHPWQKHAKWALLGTLRDCASVKVGWPYQRPALARAAVHKDPVKRFRERVEMMAADLEDAPEPLSSGVTQGDSRLPDTWQDALGGERASSCISSPPYLNNFDYADATRLELFFLGQVRSWKQLCDEVRAPMLVATTQQTRCAVADAATEGLSCYPRTRQEVASLVARLTQERTRRGRGKEYDRVLAPYFLGIAQVLACLFDNLQPGARCAWVVGDSAPYGIAIDTPSLVLLVAEELGFQSLEDRCLRDRGQRWRTNGTRHQVALTERLIVFRRPPQVDS